MVWPLCDEANTITAVNPLFDGQYDKGVVVLHAGRMIFFVFFFLRLCHYYRLMTCQGICYSDHRGFRTVFDEE